MKRLNKKDYPLTDETRTALQDNETGIARAYGCLPSYIFGIKNGYEFDPFSPFREFSQKIVLGGASLRPYINFLEELEYSLLTNRNRDCKSITEKVLSKLQTEAETSAVLIKASEDNHWDERECDKIINACDKLRREETELRQMAIARKAEIKEGRTKQQVRDQFDTGNAFYFNQRAS